MRIDKASIVRLITRLVVALSIWLVSALIGALYVTICFKIGNLNYPEGALPVVIYYAGVVVVLFLLIMALTVFVDWGWRFSTLFFLLGVAVGVVIDAFSDKTMERNVFPLEFLLWCVFFIPAIAAGKSLGGSLRKNRQSRAENSSIKVPTH